MNTASENPNKNPPENKLSETLDIKEIFFF
jgi:hypothetical protein